MWLRCGLFLLRLLLHSVLKKLPKFITVRADLLEPLGQCGNAGFELDHARLKFVAHLARFLCILLAISQLLAGGEQLGASARGILIGMGQLVLLDDQRLVQRAQFGL